MPPTLRVLQVGPLYNNHVRRWSANAAALGHEVCVAGHVRPRRRPVDLTGIAERVEVAPESLLHLGTARQVEWLRDVLDRLRPDLVQAHWLPRWGYLATLAGHRPLVVTAWGSDVYLAAGAERRRADSALRNADRVIALSRHMEQEMVARGTPAERIDRVDLGVDLHRFRPASTVERARLRTELGLPAGPVVLSLRAGTALYNLDVVIQAFGILRRRIPDATLVLVHGDAPLSAATSARLHDLRGGEGIRVVGWVPHAHVAKYLRAATAAVSIPSSDGSPNSVWEALACGLPVVLSDVPQIVERVADSGAVRLVEPLADPVASALQDVVATPARQVRMSRAARAWAVAHADEHEQLARLERLYAATATPARRLGLPSAMGSTHARARDTATATVLPHRPS